MTDLTREVLRKYGICPSLIFDVGAYDLWSSDQYQSYFPHARIVAFEASIRNYFEKCLYRLGTKQLIWAAVSDVDGFIEFNDTEGTWEGSGSILKPTEAMLRSYEGMTFGEPYRVPSIRLDTFCEKACVPCPNLLHIDAQGADIRVVRSLGTLKPQYIFMETSACTEYEGAPSSVDEIYREMVECGYRLAEQFPSDALFIRKGI